MASCYRLPFLAVVSIIYENGAVAERLRHRSCEQKVPSSIPRSGISVEVTSQCQFP